MGTDQIIIKGDPAKQAVVFIHGLGMDRRIWESPDEARILGDRFPIRFIACKEPETDVCVPKCHHPEHKGLFFGKAQEHLKTLFHDLKEEGFTVITYSQQRPSAEIDAAASELGIVITSAEPYTKAGIVLIGHSRGGLIARKYLKNGYKRIKALVTLATPHSGSRMAQWAGHLNPLLSIVSQLIPNSDKGTVAYTLKKIIDFLKSRAVKELLPDSQFFRTLDDNRHKGVYYISSGGTNPALLCLYRWIEQRINKQDTEKLILRPQKVLSVPDIFESIIPQKLFPEEMKKGYGDGLVSASSSRLPWADEHYDFDVNHAGILFDKRVRTKIIDALKRLDIL